MIATISNVRSAAETTHYLEYGRGSSRVENRTERVAWTAGYNLTPEAMASPREGLAVAQEMHDEAALNDGRAEAPFAHLKISWKSAANGGVADDPTQDEMQEVAELALETLGLTEHQAWVVAHCDTTTPHVHLLINRVSYDCGRVWRGWYSLQTLAGPLREVEAEKGWATPRGGHELAEKGYVSGGIASNTTLWEEKVGGDGTRQTFRARVADAVAQIHPRLESATGWSEVEEALEEIELHGRPLRLEPKRSGFVVTNGERYVRFSAVTSAFSKRTWEEAFGVSWKDYARFEIRAGRGRAHRLPVEWRRDWSRRLERALSATASEDTLPPNLKNSSKPQGTFEALTDFLHVYDTPDLTLEASSGGSHHLVKGSWRVPVNALPKGASLKARISQRGWVYNPSEPTDEEVAAFFKSGVDDANKLRVISEQLDKAHARYLYGYHDDPWQFELNGNDVNEWREIAEAYAEEAQLFTEGAQSLRRLEELRDGGHYCKEDVKRVLVHYRDSLFCSISAFGRVEAECRHSVSKAFERFDQSITEALKSLSAHSTSGDDRSPNISQAISDERTTPAINSATEAPGDESAEVYKRLAGEAEGAAASLKIGAEAMAALGELTSSLPSRSAAEAQELLSRYERFGCTPERFQEAAVRHRRRAQNLKAKAERLVELQEALDQRIAKIHEQRRAKTEALESLVASGADDRELADSEAAEEHKKVCREITAYLGEDALDELGALHKKLLAHLGMDTGRAALSDVVILEETAVRPKKVSDRMVRSLRQHWGTSETAQLDEQARSVQEHRLTQEQLVWQWILYVEYRRRLQLERAGAQRRRLADLRDAVAEVKPHLRRAEARSRGRIPLKQGIPPSKHAQVLRDNAANVRQMVADVDEIQSICQEAAHSIVKEEADEALKACAAEAFATTSSLEVAKHLDREAAVLERFAGLIEQAESIFDEYWPTRTSPPSSRDTTLQFHRAMSNILAEAKTEVEGDQEGLERGSFSKALRYGHKWLKKCIRERTGRNITVASSREWVNRLEQSRQRERDFGPGL